MTNRIGSGDIEGRYDIYGGQFVPEVLMPAVEELIDAYDRFVVHNASGFMDDFRDRLETYGGRPTPLTHATGLSATYGLDVYLKREDLLHGGAHKLNNALGQCLLAKYMGKDRIIAETGAGQHGTATAMAAAALDMECEIYMGTTDIKRQQQNAFRIELSGATISPVDAGRGTLKEAINETLRDWATTVEDTHYVIGSIVGPHPFPAMVRDFQSVISAEAKAQFEEQVGGAPDAVLACAGGGSNAIGGFHHFREEETVDLYAVEAGGAGGALTSGDGVAHHSASLTTGTDGVLHGALTRLLQDEHGQILESHSISAGLDYAGVGPELAALVESGRVIAATASDEAALAAFERLASTEGILPALESSHALGYLDQAASTLGEAVIVILSGRGDKDLETVRASISEGSR